MDPGSISAVPRYLVYLALLLIGASYFAACETSLSSVNRIRMISEADDGNRRAKNVLKILDNFDDALPTLLIGNNIMHIGASSVATLLALTLWGEYAVTATTLVTTLVVFLFSEMIPKSYAKACNETFAPRIAGSLIFFMKIFKPLSFVFSNIAKFIAKLVGSKEEEVPTVSEEELFDIIVNISEEDDIDEDAAELVQSALEFTVKTVSLVLTPWYDVVKINRSMSDEEILRAISEGHYSRLPVLTDDGSVEGVLHIRKFLKAKIRVRKVLKAKSMLDPAFYLPESMPIDDALAMMSENRNHMALVKDEDGEIAGIVTVEDILEELVGEIYDEEEKRGVEE